VSPTRQKRTAPASRVAVPFVVVTGMSGAGKSHALRALEDLGYFCVDNLPIALIPTFADLAMSGRNDLRRAAVVIDVREARQLTRFPAVYRGLKRRLAGRIRLVFLEAENKSLQRRFSETRRPHPLARDRSIAEAIADERRLLQPIRRLADQILDTSTLNVHELRRQIFESTGGSGTAMPLIVHLVSFAYRHGVPAEADVVLDVRFLPNPHFVPALRPWSGRSPRVARYVLRTPAATRFLKLTTDLLQFLLPQYIAEGKSQLTVGIGCTGGRHRSVAIAIALAAKLRRVRGVEIRVRHRDVART